MRGSRSGWSHCSSSRVCGSSSWPLSVLASLVLVMLGRGKPLEALLPTLGLFAAAAFRLMPSIVRIMNSFQMFRFYRPVIDTLYDELSHVDTPPDQELKRIPPFLAELELRDVSFQYPNTAAFALRNVSIRIPRGRCGRVCLRQRRRQEHPGRRGPGSAHAVERPGDGGRR